MSSISTPSPSSSTGSFSHIKCKPPPSIHRYPAVDLRDPLAPVWDLRRKATGDLEVSSERPLSEDIHDIRSSILDSDTDSASTPTQAKVAHQGRPRANTINIDTLTSTHNSGALRPSSLPGPNTGIIFVSQSAARVLGVETAFPQSQPPTAKSEDDVDVPPVDTPSTLSPDRSIQKSTLVSQRRFRNGSISAPALFRPPPLKLKKHSVVSLASAMTSSVISLSAFPQPPNDILPVPELPALEPGPPIRPQLPLSPSYILEVDPLLEQTRASPPNTPQADTSGRPMTDTPHPAVDQVEEPSAEAAAPIPTSAKGKVPVTAISVQRDGPLAVHFDFGEPPELDRFDETNPPSRRQLEEAAALPVISENGVRVPFGSLFEEQKTIVCFIRHFWCPLCQDYMFSISRNVSPDVLESAGIRLVIVSNGSYEMIKSYRRIFHTPFALYTDPTHKVYNSLGMTLQTLEEGPKGSYIRHGMVSGIGMVVKNAVKVGMPVWRPGGDIAQLGGEFILGPGLSCSWAHRMRYTRSHVPILQVVEEAGVDMRTPLERIASETGGSFLGMSSAEESKWMERRRKVLKRLRGKKMSRRGGTQWIDTASTTTATTTGSSSSPESSKRSSVQSAATAGSLCSWDPSTEAINIGCMGYEAAIIQGAEEEEQEETERQGGEQAQEEKEEEEEVVQPPFIQLSEAFKKSVEDVKSEGYDSESLISEDDSSLATELESTVDDDSVVEVQVHFEAKDNDDDESENRSSYSSVASGYETVVEQHAIFFGLADKMGKNATCISDSSLGSF